MSAYITVIKNRHELMSMIEGPEFCGICEKKGADVIWAGDYSKYGYKESFTLIENSNHNDIKYAHESCFASIETVDNNLLETIKMLFKHQHNLYVESFNQTHICAIRAVQKECGAETICTYLEKNGSDMVTTLFNTVGIQAAKEYIHAHVVISVRDLY